jgi:hypothetical protein
MSYVPTPRSLLLFGAAAGLAICSPPARAQSFEGVLTIRMATPAGGGDATYSIKGERMRMDMSMGGMGSIATILDQSTKKAYMIMPARSMYMETDIPPAAQQSDKGSFAWKGTKETIAGQECEDATAKDPDGASYDMCIARGLAVFGHAGGMRRSGPTWQDQVQGGFPLKVVKTGESEPVFEVTKIEKKSLSDDLFTPPAGYQKMSMPGRP